MAVTRKVTKPGRAKPDGKETRKPVAKKTAAETAAPAASGEATVILNGAETYTLGKVKFRKGFPKKVSDKALIEKLKGRGGMFTVRGR